MWLVDLAGGSVEVVRRPAAGSDTEHRTFGRADHVTPEAFADVIVGVRDIVG